MPCLDVGGRWAGRRRLSPHHLRGSDPASEKLKLGRETDWTDADGIRCAGIGQRFTLCGDDDIALMDIGTLRFGA